MSEPKKVFVTTLSEFRGASLNYYYFNGGSEKRSYFTGRYTCDAGARYILSTEKIDKIVMICSDATVDETRAEKDPESIAEINIPEPVPGAPKEKAKEFFLRQIKKFVDGEPESGADFQRIDGRRRQELEELVFNTLGAEKKEELFDIVAKDQSLRRKINEAIKNNIEKDYLKEKDYRKYESIDIEGILSSQLAAQENFSAEKAIHELDEIRHSSKISFLGLEFYYNAGIKRIDERIRRLEASRREYPKDVSLIKTLTDLQSIIRKLWAQLSDLQGERTKVEQEYVRHYLFSLLDEGRRAKAIPENANAQITIVRSVLKEGTANITDLVKAIRDTAEDGESIEVFIDMQGGVRTDGYIRNAVLSMLNNYGEIVLKKVVATNFLGGNFASEVVDETDRYRISELSAGINAFIQYGRAGLIYKYINSLRLPEEHRLNKLADCMIEIDHALSVCDVTRLTPAIVELRAILMSKSEESDRYSALFSVLEDSIKSDYGVLLESEKVDTVELIKWAHRKEFISQELTMIEAHIPVEIVNAKILAYDTPDGEELSEQAKYDIVDVLSKVLYNNNQERTENNTATLLKEFEKARSRTQFFDQEKAEAFLITYRKLCMDRNGVNHAMMSADRKGFAELQYEMAEFIRQFEELRAEAKGWTPQPIVHDEAADLEAQKPNSSDFSGITTVFYIGGPNLNKQSFKKNTKDFLRRKAIPGTYYFKQYAEDPYLSYLTRIKASDSILVLINAVEVKNAEKVQAQLIGKGYTCRLVKRGNNNERIIF